LPSGRVKPHRTPQVRAPGREDPVICSLFDEIRPFLEMYIPCLLLGMKQDGPLSLFFKRHKGENRIGQKTPARHVTEPQKPLSKKVPSVHPIHRVLRYVKPCLKSIIVLNGRLLCLHSGEASSPTPHGTGPQAHSIFFGKPYPMNLQISLAFLSITVYVSITGFA